MRIVSAVDAALDYYSERGAAHIKALLSRSDSPLAGIRAYFRELAESAAVAGREPSCLPVNSVLEFGHRNAAVRARGRRSDFEAARHRRKKCQEHRLRTVCTFAVAIRFLL